MTAADLFGLQPALPTLSLWEPWASLIVSGFKRHETRHWPTAIRGRVAIHAAKRLDAVGAPSALCRYAFGADWRGGHAFPLGCVVAVAELTGCFRTSGLEAMVAESDLWAGNWALGRYGFRLDNVRPLAEPLPLTGRQGFFRWQPPADLEARLGPVVDHGAAAARWAAHARELGCLIRTEESA